MKALGALAVAFSCFVRCTLGGKPDGNPKSKYYKVIRGMTAVCYDPKDVCYFHPCQNGGTCSPPKANDGDKPYTCHCFLGFGGVSCEKRQGKSADWVSYEYSSGSLRWSISGGMFYVGTWLQKMQQKWFRIEKVFVPKSTNGSTFGLLWCGTLVRRTGFLLLFRLFIFRRFRSCVTKSWPVRFY